MIRGLSFWQLEHVFVRNQPFLCSIHQFRATLRLMAHKLDVEPAPQSLTPPDGPNLRARRPWVKSLVESLAGTMPLLSMAEIRHLGVEVSLVRNETGAGTLPRLPNPKACLLLWSGRRAAQRTPSLFCCCLSDAPACSFFAGLGGGFQPLGLNCWWTAAPLM